MKSPRIEGMDGLRAYAVFLIFLIHFFGHYLNGEWGRPRIEFDAFDVQAAHGIGEWLAYYLWSSHYGVDLFFLISGFLIFRIVSRPTFSYAGFLWNRLVRIYPAYLIAVGLSLLYIARYWHQTFTLETIGENLLLLHGIWELKIPPIMTPTWSLAYEWIFYLVFPAILLFHRRGAPLGFWRLGVLAALILGAAAPIGEHYMRLLMFVLGAALARTPAERLRKLAAKLPDELVVLLYVAGNFLFVAVHDWYVFTPVYMLTCGLLFVNAVFGEGMLRRLLSLRPLMALGRVSYSFYLFHSLAVFIVCDNVGPRIGLPPGPALFALAFAGSFALALAFSAISFRLFERPYFTRRIPTHGATRVAT
ncbi:MAG TPA: acyltransferase [Burkholderiales bacterium]|nr:acyltransferase [Burkholderiales bacterium]